MKIIPATLVYAHFKGRYLMLQRNDGIWNGLGGKMEMGESPLQGAAREFCEESGVELGAERFSWLGFLAFPNFKAADHEDWWVHVFVVELDQDHGIVDGKKMAEGSLYWKSPAEILELKLWEGDTKFLPLVFERQPFQGTFWYENGKVKKFELDHVKVK